MKFNPLRYFKNTIHLWKKVVSFFNRYTKNKIDGPPDFKKHGFLSENIRSESSMAKLFPDLFASAHILNEMAHIIFQRISPQPNDLQSMVSTALFIRVLTSFASTIHLAELGLGTDAGGCARSALEAHFFLKKCIQDPTWASKFINSLIAPV